MLLLFKKGRHDVTGPRGLKGYSLWSDPGSGERRSVNFYGERLLRRELLGVDCYREGVITPSYFLEKGKILALE